MKFKEITIDEVRVGSVNLSDQETFSTDHGIAVDFYKGGKKVASIIGLMIPIKEGAEIPPFKVDFSPFVR
ncbi:MAG: hypothetical protein F4X55_05235 [Candidatus Dadabacteria bacterium]|nr:hypothetical protein [Candidatus Dadabacteria bacterium]MYC40397.1 hypothetical protein [Candidatus Dadabacteria bacterium]